MERSSVGRISSEQTVGTKRPFWLGNPENYETYISFDPIQSTTSFITSEGQKIYDDDEDAEGVSDEIEIIFDTVKNFQGIHPVSPFSATGNENEKSEKATEFIRGQELKRRNHGFGPNSLPKELQ
ncbi:hypothetical protein N7451_006744 [Penicillium sp. IBT 35674x]|nr:hypothetical protein N7451_006744 [Penicillium sp. IBT 35674x]